MSSSCVVCKNSVPSHFQSAGITQCFSCQAEEVKLAQLLTPSDDPGRPTDRCVLCSARLNTMGNYFCGSCGKEFQSTTAGSDANFLKNLHRPWMIKSASHILGPFTTQEIVTGLKKKEFVALDEITSPFRAWNLIRDVKVFTEALREAARGIMSDDATSTLNIGDQTQTVTITERSDGEIVLEDRPRASSAQPPIKQFSVPGENNWGRRAAMAGAGVVVLLIAGFFLRDFLRARFPSLAGKQNGVFEESFAAGKETVKYGDFKSALVHFRQAHAAKPDHLEATLRLAVLELQEDQTLEATRLLDTILPLDHNGLFRKEILTGLGLSGVLRADVEASRKYFAEALSADKEFNPAAVDSAAFEINQQNWPKAQDILRPFIHKDDPYPLLLLTFFYALDPSGGAGSPNDWRLLAGKLKLSIGQNNDYRQESRLALAVAQKKAGETINADAAAIEILKVDPLLTEEHARDPLYYREHLRWEKLRPLCDGLSAEVNRPELGRALSGYCAFRADRKEDGRRVLEEALKEKPDDPLINTLFAYVEYEMGHLDKADGALLMSQKLDPELELTHIVRGRRCLSAGNRECVKEAVGRLRSLNPASLHANAWMARLALEEGKTSDAEKLVEEGLMISPEYAPILRVKSELK